MNYRQFLDQVRQYTIHFFKSKDTQKLLYHNLEHTQMVVSNAEQIARHYQLGGKDFFIVMTAAWFHDSGYLTGDPADHEQRSADLAARFLDDIAVEDDTVQAVRECILATRLPQSPTSRLEKIVCDADLFHFGTDDFWERNNLMRKETARVNGAKALSVSWKHTSFKLITAAISFKIKNNKT
jgi:predicted metal-dependent HD superfamily phosphohydrolase